ncbi:carboxypeptidase regulatory-like domain-containing protein [Sphingomonas sp. GM_Shp_1]|uniref:TonB-dependent receptor n=1 Tax=Sphingomonas sp. GM_Shp_1 TaxID=2937381 RepID=UPI00226B8FC3|nr:carboxypeptidase regulatory-like domain-containing protein [Sphingomonas sp. GM_Shp_1]
MKTMMTAALRATLVTSTILGSATMLVAPAAAQTTTAQVRGQVRGADGTPAGGAQIAAVNTGTNQTFRQIADAQGNYVLGGLRPGQYRITATATSGETVTQVVVVAIGQSATLDLTIGTAAQPGGADTADIAGGGGSNVEGGEIVVTGGRLVETKTSEIATNISQEQIRTLPQTDRNFLSFAALAPGVRYNDSETDKSFSSGASPAGQVNVFIDGVSYKNNVLDSGVAGQEDSRGNPFGQLAVGEFRVLTQNYKAEYEQAGAAIITATTKSGTNEFHGEAFAQYTDRNLSSTDYFVKQAGLPKPAFERKQYGISLGGPIIKDKLFFFAAYEGNDQNRAFNVRLQNRTPENVARFGQYEGAFVSPFRGDFYFGKLTFVPDDRQTFDLIVSKRVETDITGFGGASTNAYSNALNKKNNVDTYIYRWTYRGDSFINEFNASYLNYTYNPTSLDPNSSTFNYQGVIRFGGKESTQRISQASYTLRNDLTWTGIDNHVIKGGVRFAFQDYTFLKNFFVQPFYDFRNDPTNGLDFSFPATAQIGIGNPRIAASNSQVGLYLQDDWDVTDKLQVNVGLRWDYESNLFNNNYRTPDAAAALLRQLPQTSYFNPTDYITDGTNRPPFLGAFQPRAGFSYDFKGDQSTVLFGGYGRYYDRNVFNNTLDEQFRLQYAYGQLFFSRDGRPRADGTPTVVWNDRYLTRDGLLSLIANAQTGQPELFAVKNNARPPVTDQFTLGVRQRIGIFQASLSGSYVAGRNGYTHLFATRNADGTCCNVGDGSPTRNAGFSNVLIGYDGLKTRYKALFFTLDKNYTQSSGWGFNLAYTLSKGEQNGNDLFSLQYATPEAYGYRPRPGDERHRLVLSGIVDLPLGFKFSTITTLGSGSAYQVTDETRGSTPSQVQVYTVYPPKNCIKGIAAFCEVNMTLQNDIEIFAGHKLNLAVDLLNAFNSKNFGGFDDFTNATDPLTQLPRELITLPRRVQFRVGYRF